MFGGDYKEKLRKQREEKRLERNQKLKSFNTEKEPIGTTFKKQEKSSNKIGLIVSIVSQIIVFAIGYYILDVINIPFFSKGTTILLYFGFAAILLSSNILKFLGVDNKKEVAGIY